MKIGSFASALVAAEWRTTQVGIAGKFVLGHDALARTLRLRARKQARLHELLEILSRVETTTTPAMSSTSSRYDDQRRSSEKLPGHGRESGSAP